MKHTFLKSIPFLIFITLLIIINTSQAKSQQQQLHIPKNLNSTTVHQTDDDDNHEYITQMLAGFLSFLAAAISSAGGIGGGGLFIPILTILAALDMKTATAYSAFMVTGGSIANVGCHAFGKRRGLIDYDIALLSEPLMLLGVSCGVICNRVFPEWLIMVFFVVFLAFCTFKTCNSGVLYWKLESEELRVRRRNGGENGEASFDESTKEPLLEETVHEDNVGVPWMKIGMLLAIWLAFFVLYVLRGNSYGKGIIQIEPCGTGYWIISAAQVPIAFLFTALILYGGKSQKNNDPTQQENESRTRCDTSHKLTFPLMALLAGALGGVFGIGGGMLISPLLLQIGIGPEVTAATCSFMVLFSSTMSAVQYLLLGMEHINGALSYASICFAGSLVGLILVQKAINKHGRASLIVFSVGIVMALSTVLITTFGAMDVWKDYNSGKSMGFKTPC